MQIVRTEIARATAPTGETVLRVLFHGEGGDRVTVDMAGPGMAEDKAAALDRAKAILVQTAPSDWRATTMMPAATATSMKSQ